MTGDDADLVTRVEVARTSGGAYHLDWRAAFGEHPITIYVARDPAALGAGAPLAVAAQSGLAIEQLDPGQRYYFSLTPPSGVPLIVAQRDVPFEGCVNFRDLGGYLCEQGQRVRWGALYRSGHMAKLSATDLNHFATLDIRTVCDFRVQEERANEAAMLPGQPRQEVLGVMPGIGDRDYFRRIFAAAPDPNIVLDAMHDIMRSFVTDAIDKYRRLFEILLETTTGNVLLNCSAGKERTGIGAALVLSALGVPRRTVLYDFMLSERYFPAESEIPRVREKYGVTDSGPRGRALIMPLLETRESYLQSAFAIIDRDYGSTLALLEARCDLGPNELRRLRTRYTQ